MRCRSASVPLSPSNSCATSPGMRCMPKNTRMLTPSKTGPSWSRRHRRNLSITVRPESRRPGPCQLDRQGPGTSNRPRVLLQGHEFHIEEHLERVEDEPFDVRARRPHLVGVVHENPGRVIMEEFVRLLVQRGSLRLIRRAPRVPDEPVEGRAVMAGCIVGARSAVGDVPLKEISQEVIRVAVVARPPGNGKPLPRLAAEPG